MGTFYSKFRQLWHYSPTLSMMALATFLYLYVFHGLPQVWRKSIKGKKQWSIGVGRKASGIVGLKNFGNTCYFNSCIQALAACSMFCAWVERRNLMNDVRKNKKQDSTDDNDNELSDDEESLKQLPFPVIAALHEAFSLINAKTTSRDPCLSEMIPSRLICAFTKHNLEAVKNKRMRRFVLNSHEEQDTHEAFNYILETIADECSNLNKNYHTATNLALNDSMCIDEDIELDSHSDSVPFCKLTRASDVGATDDCGDTKSMFDEVKCAEEDECVNSEKVSRGSSSCSDLRPSPRTGRRQRSYNFIRPSGSGDSISKGKRSNKDWLGGSIVSRTEIHESDIREDTLMTQNISFDGTLGVKLVCMACNTQNPTSLDKFNCLTVTLPRTFSYPIKLEDLMLHSLRPTQVHGVDCEGCFKRFGKPTTSSFVKYTAIGRMPQTLCIHISRSEWTVDGICIKRNDYVKFPLYLNMNQFKRISDLMNQTPTMQGVPTYGEMGWLVGDELLAGNERIPQDFDYILKAVICHCGGSADSGHFTTYRQSCSPTSVGQGWYFISDCQACTATLPDVLSCKAYMLFYEKKIALLPGMIDLNFKK